MGIENYNLQKDLYYLLQADTTDLLMKSENGEFHIVHVVSPTEKMFYPFNCKFSMEKDYEALLEMMQGIIQKQITLVTKMGDMANPRKVVKGFKKENVTEDTKGLTFFTRALKLNIKSIQDAMKRQDWGTVSDKGDRIRALGIMLLKGSK